MKDRQWIMPSTSQDLVDNSLNSDTIIDIDQKYSIDCIFLACNSMMGRYHFKIESKADEKGFVIKVFSKDVKKIDSKETIKSEFNEKLDFYSQYIENHNNTSAIMTGLIEESLLKSDIIEDPEGIAMPWEEKYGKRTAD
jgi:hypothetical protein